jgi:hypothetical protein
MKILESYNEKKMLGYFTDGRTIYELHMKNIWFFGLIVEDITVDFSIPFEHDSKCYFDLWDDKIKHKTPIEKNKFSFKEGIVCFFVIVIVLPFILVDKLISFIKNL